MLSHLRSGFAVVVAVVTLVAFGCSVPASAQGKRQTGPSAAAGSRLAFLVGINDYNGLFDLKNAVNDVRLVERTLKLNGFDVSAIYDTDRATFEQALEAFAKKITPTSTVVFYYAGHGFQDNGSNMLLLRDTYKTVEDLERSSHKLLSVYQTLRKTSTTTVLMFLDTCRTEFLDVAKADNVSLDGERSIVRGRGIAQLSKGFTFFTGDINTFVSFSTQPGNVAQDGNAGNSPYTAALAKHMKVAGIDLSAVMARTRKDVYDTTNGAQTPWDHSSLTSTFEFRICGVGERIIDGECRVPPKPVVVTPPPPPQQQQQPQPQRSNPKAERNRAGRGDARPAAPRAARVGPSDRGGGGHGAGGRRGGGLPPDIGAGVGAGL